ncbi:MAG: flagellar hook basal-body protein [Oscillospiraceae bacterium]
MLRGYYSAASGMLATQRSLNVIGNNITNVQTPGFQAERANITSFDQELVTRLENGVYTKIGTGSQVTVVDTVTTAPDESSVYETSNPFDLAIVGEGYFNVQGDGKTFLTRNGCFNIDTEGYLVLDGVGRVQGETGDLYVGGSDFTVDQSGNVYDAQGNLSGALKITKPAADAEMVKLDNGYFLADNAEDVALPTIQQNAYERSNVDVNDEYTRLIETQAAFKACATALGIVDAMNAKAASSLASLT